MGFRVSTTVLRVTELVFAIIMGVGLSRVVHNIIGELRTNAVQSCRCRSLRVYSSTGDGNTSCREFRAQGQKVEAHCKQVPGF